MTKRIHIVAFGMALLLATSIVSASAFTTATITRDAQIAVAADDSSIIQITPNTAVPGIEETGTPSRLLLDLDEGSSLNPDSNFVFGDTSSSSSTDAFTISTSGTSTDYNVEMQYVEDTDDDAGDNDVTFSAYPVPSSGSWYDQTAVSVTEENGAQPLDFSSYDTYKVVVTVDTDSEDLSGTLEITANSP